MLPQTTRLRYIKAKSPDDVTKFCDLLSKRIEVKTVYAEGGYVFLWFVPDDKLSDVPSGEIKIIKQGAKELIGYVRSRK
jgi:hypothetical protein